MIKSFDCFTQFSGFCCIPANANAKGEGFCLAGKTCSFGPGFITPQYQGQLKTGGKVPVRDIPQTRGRILSSKYPGSIEDSQHKKF